mmetsp:Transcript_10622/g.17581  ORF Transcript_10622/g.17581 Transcript_10622/m.17581 type:complete len:564 (-) Transcript_10622:155-1846(-)|eukprot:CAMPEP_0119005174 /NCGR_PEP_ID=MMETSP1176-20130426/1566_1 /TAXON_ID=265551 /ORGANISM="Synedropsis recta cf, Strain CCMP1620" /LENGTH=563 /DNA_ID=CAMNT_0006956951 /DNA_START=46 /DNA_END=1737 /DNA_ORIENTATION=+
MWNSWLSWICSQSRTRDDDRSFASGELEYEYLHQVQHEHDVPQQQQQQQNSSTSTSNNNNNNNKPRFCCNNTNNEDMKLMLAFCALIVLGTGNTILIKLQAIPLYNYPNFTNLFGCFIFIPLLFAYILPAYTFGWFHQSISEEQWRLSGTRPFIIMGGLDCLAGMMQVFAAVYLPGPLLVLLPQAAIPMSMVFSQSILGNVSYRKWQYVGAMVVLAGIGVVLEPELTHRHSKDFLCEAVNLTRDCTICQVELTEDSCLSHRLDIDSHGDDTTTGGPQFAWLQEEDTFSAILKQDTNNNHDDDDEGQPICEWIAAASTNTGEHWLIVMWSGIMILSCIPMTLSTLYKELALSRDNMDPVFLNGWIVVFQTTFSALLAAPAGMALSPQVLPKDLPRNLYDGFQCYYNGKGSITDGCHPDDSCPAAALYFNLGVVVNLCFMLTMMLVVKWGSTSLLFLALTIMVPLGNVAFALMGAPVHVSDLMGLGIILGGLMLYRFSGKKATTDADGSSSIMMPTTDDDDDDDDVLRPLDEEEVVLVVDEEEEPSNLQMLREPLLALPRRTGDV